MSTILVVGAVVNKALDCRSIINYCQDYVTADHISLLAVDDHKIAIKNLPTTTIRYSNDRN